MDAKSKGKFWWGGEYLHDLKLSLCRLVSKEGGNSSNTVEKLDKPWLGELCQWRIAGHCVSRRGALRRAQHHLCGVPTENAQPQKTQHEGHSVIFLKHALGGRVESAAFFKMLMSEKIQAMKMSWTKEAERWQPSVILYLRLGPVLEGETL